MRNWFAIIGVGAAAGYAAVYIALSRSPESEAHTHKQTEAATAQTTAADSLPAGSVVLSHVVEVTDTDPLLDSRPVSQPSGIPFDPTEPLEPRTSVSVILPTAPMPRSVD